MNLIARFLNRPILISESGMLAIQAAAESREMIEAASKTQPAKAQSDILTVDNGHAVIAINGLLVFKPSLFERILFGASDIAEISDAVSTVASDPAMKSLKLDFNTPGGEVQGIQELAAKVSALRIPTASFCGGQMCSAGYWIGASADRVFATASSEVGSVGALLAVLDKSKMMENVGLRLNLFTSGTLKGAGFAGAALTDAQSAHLAAQVQAIAGQFINSVKSRRKIDASIEQGGSYFGFQSKKLGLVDEIVADFGAFMAATSDAQKPRVFETSAPEEPTEISRASFEMLPPKLRWNYIHNGGRVVDAGGSKKAEAEAAIIPTLSRAKFFGLSLMKQAEFIRGGGTVNG